MPRKRPSRRIGRPPNTNSAETEQRIIDAARIAFGTWGFESTTNQHIADPADISPSTIYHYFESKQDLWVAVFDKTIQVVLEAWSRAVDTDRPLAEQVRQVLHASLEIHAADESIAHFCSAADVDVDRF